MRPFTTVVMTYNTWGNFWWEERAAAMRALLETRPPDILAVQELKPPQVVLFDDVLAGHERVHDDFVGWSKSGNIWWNRDLYELEEYGAEDIGMRAEPARLFWVRLRVKALDGMPSLFVADAHYTFPGHKQEWLDDVSPRTNQARRTVEELDRLAGDRPCLFVGDLNDHSRPIKVLRDGGFRDAFSTLGRVSLPTYPAVPNAKAAAGDPSPESVPVTIDFQFHRGDIEVRSAEVVEFFHRGIAPSDHRPIVATYTLPGRTTRTPTAP